MARTWLLQVFAVLVLIMKVKDTAGFLCSCTEKEINCSSRSFTQYTSTYIPIECKRLKMINLSNNKFEMFPSLELMNFYAIDISRNKLDTLPPEYSQEVKMLDVSGNKIQKIELKSTLNNLEQLYASNQNVQQNDIDFSSGICHNLHILDVSKNHLKSLASVTNCENISLLNSSHNYITDLPKEFKSLVALKHLDLSWNNLETLSELPKNLETLNLSHNNLTQIQSQSFKSMNVLIELDLSNNFIKELDAKCFSSLIALNRLDLSHNFLSLIPPLQLSNQMRNVLLNDNNITNVNENRVINILGSGDVQRKVDVRKNPIHNLDSGLKALIQHLDLKGSKVDIEDTCACINVTHGIATLLLCVDDHDSESQCWVDIARQTTSTTTVETTSTTPIISTSAKLFEVNNKTQTNASDAMTNNGTESVDAAKIDITYASHFMSSLGAAKLSFLAFLIVTLLILIIINCIVGDPVVDDQWWEEKVRGDHVVT